MKNKKNSIYFINAVRLLILKKNLFEPNQTILFSLSGGQDSICLLLVFFILKKQLNINLKIFFCNHLWQENSLYNDFHIFKVTYCFKLEINFFVSFKNLLTEEKSRYWRSKIFLRLFYFTKNSTILTGHNLTDQIETFFFNLTRGSGFKGNCSLQIKKKYPNVINNNLFSTHYNLVNFISLKKNRFFFNEIDLKYFQITKNFLLKKKSNLFFFKKNKLLLKKKQKISNTIIRPLLTQTRFDILKLCNNLKLPIFPDSSNQKTFFSRNRLRKQLLPSIRFFFNPKIDFILNRYNLIILSEEYYFENLIKKILVLISNENNNAYFINLGIFFSLSISFQRRFCFFFFKEKLFRNFNFLEIDQFLLVLKKNYLLLKKDTKYMTENKKMISLFFPKIGIIFLLRNSVIFLK